MRTDTAQLWMVLPLALGALAASGDSRNLDERRQRLFSMTAERLDHIEHNRERLAQLPADEQARLRLLADAIAEAPDHERLEVVMTRYDEWLRKLSLPQRSELLELPPAERLAKIKQFRAAQRDVVRAEAAGGEPLSASDIEHILKFIEGQAVKNEQRLLAEATPERRQQIEKMESVKRRRALIWELAKHSHGGKGAGELPLMAQEINALVDRLSPPAQDQFRQADSAIQQRQLVRHWIQLAIRQRIEEAGLTRPLPAVAAEDLRQFFESLPPAQRDQLLSMPPDKMQRELRRLFFLQPTHPEPARAEPPHAEPAPAKVEASPSAHGDAAVEKKSSNSSDEKASKARRSAERARSRLAKEPAAKDGAEQSAPKEAASKESPHKEPTTKDPATKDTTTKDPAGK